MQWFYGCANVALFKTNDATHFKHVGKKWRRYLLSGVEWCLCVYICNVPADIQYMYLILKSNVQIINISYINIYMSSLL